MELMHDSVCRPDSGSALLVTGRPIKNISSKLELFFSHIVCKHRQPHPFVGQLINLFGGQKNAWLGGPAACAACGRLV
jgi:hypothetical protein